MPQYGTKSLAELQTCDKRLRVIFMEVIKGIDCSILCGTRGEEKQDFYYRVGLSKLKYPNSKHNIYPSLAVDVAPYPIDWDDERRFYILAGYVLKASDDLGIPIRWGGDWDGDMDLKDQNFHDLVHFELIQNV